MQTKQNSLLESANQKWTCTTKDHIIKDLQISPIKSDIKRPSENLPVGNLK